jgi:hypothetical protein
VLCVTDVLLYCCLSEICVDDESLSCLDDVPFCGNMSIQTSELNLNNRCCILKHKIN